MKYIALLIFLSALTINSNSLHAQGLEEVELNSDWMDMIKELAPEEPAVKPAKVPRILVFTLSTEYQHWVVPHTTSIMEILSAKTGAFVIDQTVDIQVFEDLKGYDAVLLNNNCSAGERRDLFWDELGKNKDLTGKERDKKAARLEKNLIEFVKSGGGLMVVHGGIVMQNNSMEFSEMVGGSFDYHPVQQEVQVELVEPDHPLLTGFKGQTFVHVDEPYIFKNAYFDYDFRPLLSMDASALHSLKEEIKDPIIYISWIKRYGKGRVFYISPSHNAQSYEDPRLLQFYLDGLQYVTGDLKCDDSPMKRKP
ncbi:MAG: ThuA domain-containing protein [Bacteroidales bacterium]